MNKIDIRICEKFCLNITEASACFGIGEKKLRQLIDDNPYANWIIRNGVKQMIKRELFEAFLTEVSSI